MKHVELAQFPAGAPPRNIYALVERGQELKTASDLLGKYKHEMLAKHKKTCFDRIQTTRTVHDALWDTLNAGKPHPKAENVNRVQKNLDINYERYRKAATALRISSSLQRISAGFLPAAMTRRSMHGQPPSWQMWSGG